MDDLLSSAILRQKQTSGVAPPDGALLFYWPKRGKSLRCAGHVWRVKAATSIQVVLIGQESALPPQSPRLLRASPIGRVATIVMLLAFLL